MRKSDLTTEDYVRGIVSGDRVLLARAITLVESARPEHQVQAQALIGELLARGYHGKNSFRIGVTGAPGVGKSSFIEALGEELLAENRKIAVLAIDPSSQISRGSILGDKTRMEKLSVSPHAFVRPSPAGTSLGGVARKTRETVILVEAAGYDTVFIETVGVGQSETAVHSMVDLFLLLIMPGAGDELQGIKRGIVEMADLILVNKADGDRLPLAREAMAFYRNAVHLLPPKESGWAVQVLLCSAMARTGMQEVQEAFAAYREQAMAEGYLASRRRKQNYWWFRETLLEGLKNAFFQHDSVKREIPRLEEQVMQGAMSPFAAAEEALRVFLG